MLRLLNAVPLMLLYLVAYGHFVDQRRSGRAKAVADALAIVTFPVLMFRYSLIGLYRSTNSMSYAQLTSLLY